MNNQPVAVALAIPLQGSVEWASAVFEFGDFALRGHEPRGQFGLGQTRCRPRGQDSRQAVTARWPIILSAAVPMNRSLA